MPSASPGATVRSISSVATSEPKVLRRPVIFSMRLNLASESVLPEWVCGLVAARLALGLTDRLHLAAGRNVRRRPVVGNDDVVLVAVL